MIDSPIERRIFGGIEASSRLIERFTCNLKEVCIRKSKSDESE